jgi:CheY-like chemotaxis protein
MRTDVVAEKILVVDDELALRSLLKDFLTSLEYEVPTATISPLHPATPLW